MKRSGTLLFVIALGVLVVSGCSSSPSGSGVTGTTSTASPGTLIAPGSAGTTPPHDVAVDVAPTPASPEDQKSAAGLIGPIRGSLPYSDEQMACVVDRLARNQPLLADARKSMAEGSAGYGGVVRLAQVCVQAVTFAPQWAANIQSQSGGTLTETQMRCLTEKYASLPTDVLERVNQASVDMTAPGRSELEKQMGDMVASCGVKLP